MRLALGSEGDDRHLHARAAESRVGRAHCGPVEGAIVIALVEIGAPARAPRGIGTAKPKCDGKQQLPRSR